MKPNNRNMDNKQCRKKEATSLNDDAEQQPDCSGVYSIEVMPDQFAFTDDGDDEQAMKRTRHTNKEKERKDRIKNDIQEIRSLLPPLYTSEKKQTHHELLQNAITFIRVLIDEKKELTSCHDIQKKDLENDKLRKENEELKIKNKQYRNFLDAVGIPEMVDLSQLEVSWKLRDTFASDSEACAVDCDESIRTINHSTADQSETTCISVTSNESQVKDEENVSTAEPNESKEADKTNDDQVAETSNIDEAIYTSPSADDIVDESVVVQTSSDPSVSDVVQKAPGSVVGVSSMESEPPVFMLPDSGSDEQVEVEKTTTSTSSSSRLPPSHSNGNLSDISEPASDTECSDGPMLTVSRLALENAFRQTGMLSVGMGDSAHKTSVPEVTLKTDEHNSSVGMLHGHVVSDDDGHRYMQMMHQVSYATHLSNGSVEPMLGLSCSARFAPPPTCPISPNVIEPTTTGLGQINNVMMLPSGQLVLVSPQHGANSSMLHTSEPGMAPMLSSGGGGSLSLAPHGRHDNGLQHAPHTGLFTTNFGINSGLTLGAQAVGSMPTVSTNNTLFVNPPVQYGVPHQPMTFISNGQQGNVLPIMQPSCPSVSHLTVAQNQAMTLNTLHHHQQQHQQHQQQQASQNHHPSALILPNGQIVPVVTQPSLLFPQQQCTPVTGGLLMPSVQTPGLNIIGNIQNHQSQLRFGSNLLPTSTIQPQVITNIANMRTPTYGLLQNTNQTNQQQYQLVGNSLQPIGNMNNGNILLSQPRHKDSFTIKNMATSLSGLALPGQNPGQFTLLPGNCINAMSSQHLNTSGIFGGSCSTTMSTAVPLLQAKPNPCGGSTAALSNIPATLTAMLTPEGSIILAIPNCRGDGGDMSSVGNNQMAMSKAQKVAPRPLMPKPASKLDAVSQLATSNTPLSSSKVCPSMMSCDFVTSGASAISSVTSSPMLPLTVNTTSNMDFGCILSGPSSTTSSTDILAKATKSIFSISPYEHLSPRSSFNSGISENLFTFSSAGLAAKPSDASVLLRDGKSTAATKPKRSKTKAKPVKKKSVKNAACGLTSLPDICHHIIHPSHDDVVTTVEMSPQHAIVDQLGNDEDVSDINDFSDLIRMEPMTPASSPKAVTTESEQPTSDPFVEKHEVTDVTDLTDDLTDDVTDDLTESSEKGISSEIRSDSGIAEINQRTPEFDFVNFKDENNSEKSKDATSFSVSEMTSVTTSEMPFSPKKSDSTSDVEADTETVTVKDLQPAKEMVTAERTSIERTSTERTSTETTSTETTSTERTSAERTSAERTSAERTSAERMSAERTSAEKTSAERTSTKRASTERKLTERTSTERTSTERTSAETTSTETTSAERTSIETTSCREVGTSTERKRKKHKKPKIRSEPDFSLVREGKQGPDCKRSSDKHGVMGFLSMAFSSMKENESSASVKFGTGEKLDVMASSKSSFTPCLDKFGSENKPFALTEETCAMFFKKEAHTSSSRKSVNGVRLNEGRLEEGTQTSRSELHHGSSHSKSGLGKKSRKRSHKSSSGYIKPEMLPDMLMFTESELMDVVDKVENMMVTDERDTRKRLHDDVVCQELTVSENNSVKKTKSDERVEVVSVEETKELLCPEASEQLSWPLSNSAAVMPTDVLKDVVPPEIPSCLPVFEMEDEVVGFAAEFSSNNSPTPIEIDEDPPVASPVFTLELVVPEIAESSPGEDLLEQMETKQPDCCQSPAVEDNDLPDVVVLPDPTPPNSQLPSLPDEQEQTMENEADCVLEALPSIEPHTPSVASQARHSGIVSLARQVAPSKHQSYVSAAAQPKSGTSSKHTATARQHSQGNSRVESDSVVATSSDFTSSAPTTASLDTYSENIFSGGRDHYLPSSKDHYLPSSKDHYLPSSKDHYLPSSKDLGLDFSFELDAKDKTSPSCDVASAYDWGVLTDADPPPTSSSASLSISSPTQKQFDCEVESKSAPIKTSSTSTDCVATLPPCVQISVGCTSSVTHTTSSHHTLSSSSSVYTSPSKTPTEPQLMMQTGYATARQSTPSSSHHNATPFSAVVSTDVMSGHGRNSSSSSSAATTHRGQGSTCTTSAVMTPLCHSLVVTSSNFRSSSGVSRSPMPALTPNATSTPCSALNHHHKSSSLPSSSSSIVCSSSAMKSNATSCSNSSSRSSCSQKSSESHAVRSAALPLDSTMSSSSMYHRSSSATDRLDRPSCSKEGPMRPNPDYFGASSQMSTSSSCAVQGKSHEDMFHYPLPPYVFNAATREYSQFGGGLSRFSSTAGNAAMLSSASCASEYNALARCSLYFPAPFSHDLGLDMSHMTHQRMSPNHGLSSCSIEKHSSSAKVGSATNNRLDATDVGAKSCQARHHDNNGYSGFPGSLMLSHNNQDVVAQCSSHFIEPPRVANAHGLLAHNRDSGGAAGATARGNQRLSGGGMQQNNASASRSRSVTRSPAAANERPTSFALHNGGYTGSTAVVSSLASPPLHHHSASASDRHCLNQHLSYDLSSFHAPAIQTFSPNLNVVGFDPPPLNFSRDCGGGGGGGGGGGNVSSPHVHHSKKTGKKADEHNAVNTGSKMVLSHSKQQQQQQPSSAQQSHQPVKSSSGSNRSSRSSKKTVKTTTSGYDVDSSNMFENRSVTPYFGLGNISPNMNPLPPPDGLAYVNFFSNTGRPLSNAAAKTLHHRDPPPAMTHPFNSSLFSPSRTQTGLGLNFQTGFGMDHMSSTHITSSQMIIPHSGSISAHMHGFGHFFPDISGSMVQRDALNSMSSMKFGPSSILPSQGSGVEPSPLHHPQTAGSAAAAAAMYNNRGQLPPHMLHDMGFNALLSHQHAAFDASRSISGGMVHPPFGSHSHAAASFGMGPLNFPVHNL